MRRLIIAAVLLVAFGNSAAQNEWDEVFQRDRQAIYELIRDNHPGPVDEKNPDFVKWMEEGYQIAREIDDDNSYVYGLLEYVSGFRDGHLSLRTNIERDTRFWPGFLTAWRNGALQVYESSKEELPAGAGIESCDGIDAETLIQERYFRFQGDPEIPSHWTAAGARTFIDLGNPFVGRPQECTIVVDGERRTVTLEWQAFAWDELLDRYLVAAARKSPDASYSSIAENVVWFSAPTFGPDEATVEIYQHALDELAEVTSPDALIVIDLRGNSGGASMWANRISQAIWGAAEPEEDDGYVEWRPSNGNIEYWKQVPEYLIKQFGEDDPSLRWARLILDGMLAAREAEQELWRQPEINLDEELEKVGEQRDEPFAGKVLVLTDSQCASSCLDGMDQFHGRPNVTHIGGTTSADTEYMEVRSVDLPSGHATLVVPLKVYRGRKRPEGGYYEPEIPYTGMHWTDEAITEWVLSLWREDKD